VENALAAISLSALLGVPLEYVKSGLAKAKSPGRMEVFYSKDGKRIAIVDYAHNKLSYEKFFETIKDEFPDKKMMIVFGCPGGKAFARREELGTIAGQHCTHSIIAEEDYGEDGTVDILTILVKAGLEKSRGDARRDVTQGGITVDGEKVTDFKAVYTKDALKDGKLVKRGKKNYKLIKS
jgi:UDP-N-acetylmuramyl tripeptide synthase